MKISNKTYRWELGETTYTEVNLNTMYAVNKKIATDEEIDEFKINYWDGNKKSYIIGYLTAFGNRREKLAKTQYKEVKK